MVVFPLLICSKSWLIEIIFQTGEIRYFREERCDVVSSCPHRAIGLWVLCGGNLASTGPTSCQRERTSRLSSHNRLVIKGLRSNQEISIYPSPVVLRPLSFSHFIICPLFVASSSCRRPLVSIQTETPVRSVGRLQPRGGSV